MQLLYWLIRLRIHLVLLDNLKDNKFADVLNFTTSKFTFFLTDDWFCCFKYFIFNVLSQ